MKPEEKLTLEIEQSLDKYRSKLSNWEIDFLNTIRDLLLNPFKSASVKQKNMCRAINTRVRT